MVNACKKGKVGESEFLGWIFQHLQIETERNYNQSSGGADIIIDDFMFEIKRREVLNLADWWLQVCIAKKKHKNPDLIPVVAYRENRKPWKFLIPANLIHGIQRGFLIADEKVFLQLAKGIIS